VFIGTGCKTRTLTSKRIQKLNTTQQSMEKQNIKYNMIR